MKIAVFTPYLPYPPDTGGKIRSYHMLRALARRFEVDLYTIYYGKRPSEESIDFLERHCQKVSLFRLEKKWRNRNRTRSVLAPLSYPVDHFHTPRSLSQAKRCLRDGEYDLLVIDEMCMTPYAEIAPHLPKIVIRHKVDYVHYREVARARPWGLEKALDFIDAVKMCWYGKAKMPLYQAYVACSEQDAELISRDAPDIPALVIPNGVDLSTFVPGVDSRSERPVLLYVGSMYYYPNIDAVEFFFETMYDTIHQVFPNVQVQIVGHKPPPEIQHLDHRDGVTVTGSVPDVRPYYEQADVFIVPLRLGGGTRLKIVEAMAMRIPVVSTTVGAEGLDISPGDNILIADEPQEFVEKVKALLLNPDLRERIIEGGQALAQRYGWRELTKPFADLAEAVVQEVDKDKEIGRANRIYD